MQCNAHCTMDNDLTTRQKNSGEVYRHRKGAMKELFASSNNIYDYSKLFEGPLESRVSTIEAQEFLWSILFM